MLNPLNYPLRFEPIVKRRIWGGRRLETVLGKKLPPGELIGESWEISDHGDDVSVVANGPQRGKTLRELLTEFHGGLSGVQAKYPSPPAPLPQGERGGMPPSQPKRFPLLIKWLDAHENLSVQVHPPDRHPRLPPGERAKTESWFVLDADAQAEIYLGLRRGIDRATLQRELARDTVDRCLNTFPARPGDFFFVPAGTVHAIGGGVLLAEIQQCSDTTFRLSDWNRIDPAIGQPRDLQIDAALDSIDFRAQPREPLHNPAGPSAPARIELLDAQTCPHFAVVRRVVRETESFDSPDRFHVLICTGGGGEISGGGECVAVARGDCLLLPAGGPFNCQPRPQLELLDTWVP